MENPGGPKTPETPTSVLVKRHIPDKLFKRVLFKSLRRAYPKRSSYIKKRRFRRRTYRRRRY